MEYIKNLNFEKFLKETKAQDAVIRNIEIIGEAVKNISDNIKSKYLNKEWKNIARIRDNYSHIFWCKS